MYWGAAPRPTVRYCKDHFQLWSTAASMHYKPALNNMDTDTVGSSMQSTFITITNRNCLLPFRKLKPWKDPYRSNTAKSGQNSGKVCRNCRGDRKKREMTLICEIKKGGKTDRKWRRRRADGKELPGWFLPCEVWWGDDEAKTERGRERKYRGGGGRWEWCEPQQQITYEQKQTDGMEQNDRRRVSTDSQTHVRTHRNTQIMHEYTHTHTGGFYMWCCQWPRWCIGSCSGSLDTGPINRKKSLRPEPETSCTPPTVKSERSGGDWRG